MVVEIREQIWPVSRLVILMLSDRTKTQILASRFAYEEGELVTVNARDLCEDIIRAEKVERLYRQLSKDYSLLKVLYDRKCAEPIGYKHIDLRS